MHTLRGAYRITKVILDWELQHQDHWTNNLVPAFARSLDQNVIVEISHLGPSASELVAGGKTDIFWHDRRTAEVLKSLIREHVLRLAIVASSRLKRYEVERMLVYAHLLVQAEDHTAIDIGEASFGSSRRGERKAKGLIQSSSSDGSKCAMQKVELHAIEV